MGAPASALDELDGSRVLHALGALAVDLQDFIADLRGKTRKGKRGREGGKSDRVTGEDGGERRQKTSDSRGVKVHKREDERGFKGTR